MNTKVQTRIATILDVDEILKIYSFYVENTAISFEYEVPSREDFLHRIAITLENYPYIIATIDDKIVGYAYAAPFKSRPAYDWAVETTVYVEHTNRNKGIGKILYVELEKWLIKQNILNMNACIAYATEEGERLDNSSTEFHKALGFVEVGHFSKCGYKFGCWYDMIWMEKIIGNHLKNPKNVIPFSKLNK